MYNGLLIQNLDIANVSSERRNPILANVMAQLDFMEKRGSGLTRICNETKALEGYKDELKPVFQSTPTQFQTIIYANVEEKVGVKDVTKDVTKELPERQLVILQMISANASITISAMSQKTGVVIRTIKRDIENLQTSGCLTRKGGRKDGEWLLTELGLATLEKLKK